MRVTIGEEQLSRRDGKGVGQGGVVEVGEVLVEPGLAASFREGGEL